MICSELAGSGMTDFAAADYLPGTREGCSSALSLLTYRGGILLKSYPGGLS